jgi:tetratricopeptide (TPR) repeat protein
MRFLSRAIIAMTAFMLATAGAMAQDTKIEDSKADDLKGCDGGSPDIRIAPCTALIDAPDTSPAVRARAFFLRGVAYAQLGRFQRAIRDYGEAIRIVPQYPMALNNRADAWLRLGEPAQGLADIEQALAVNPQEPLYNTTRGEIAQAIGDRDGAIRDHEAALALGGVKFIKFYQCGLRLQRLYQGPLDGILSPELRTALHMCVDKGAQCDPALPFLTSECPELVG